MWDLLVSVNAVNAPAWRFDVVDVGRQVLTNLFYDMYTLLIAAYIRQDRLSVVTISTALLDVLTDWDMLLNTHESFLLGTWIRDARAMAHTKVDADLFEFNARNQITLWGPNGEIDDYASKNWAGLAKGYYYHRWVLFTNMLLESLNSDSKVDMVLFSRLELQLGQQFCADTNTQYSTEATGKTVSISIGLQTKYGDKYESPNAYAIQAHTDIVGYNIIRDGMYTNNTQQLMLLCDLDSDCAGFTSSGFLKSQIGSVTRRHGVSVYSKVL